MHFADHRDGGAMVDMVLGEDTPGYRARGGPLGVPLAWVSLLPRRRVEASFFVRPVSTQRSLRYRRRTDVQRLVKKKKTTSSAARRKFGREYCIPDVLLQNQPVDAATVSCQPSCPRYPSRPPG